MKSTALFDAAQHYARQARILYESNNLNEAVELYREALSIYLTTNNLEEYYSIAAKINEIYFRFSQFRECIRFMKETLAAFPNTPQTPLNIVEIYVELGNTYCAIEEFEQGIEAFRKGLEVTLEKFGSEPHVLLNRCYNGIGLSYSRIRQADLGIPYFEKALAVGVALWGKQHEYNSRSCMGLALCWFLKKNYEKTLYYINCSLEIGRTIEHQPLPALASDLGLMARCYSEMGDYDKALLYFQQAVHTAQAAFHHNPHPLTVSIYENMGKCVGKKGDTQAEIDYYQKALQISSDFYKSDNMRTAELQQKIGWWYAQNPKAYKQAIPYFEQSVAVYQSIVGSEHPLVISGNNAIAECYLCLNEPQKAYNNLTKSLEQVEKTSLGETHLEAGNTFNLLATYCMGQKNYQQAAIYCQKALNSLIVDYHNTNIYDTPIIHGNYHLALDLLKVLQNKAQVLTQLHQQTANINDLKVAFDTYQAIVYLLGEIRHSYSQEGSKLTLVQNHVHIYEQSIAVANQLYQLTNNLSYLHKCFSFAEKSRSLLLLSAIKDAEAKIMANIDPQLLDQEKQLRLAMSYLDEQLYKEQIKGIETDYLQNLQKQRFECAEVYEKLVANLERTYPDYYQLKYNVKTISVTAIQQHLQKCPHKTVIEYLVGKELIYVFSIGVNHYQLHILPKPTDLDDQIAEFSEALNALNYEEYVSYGYQLYQTLLQPVLHNLPQSNTPSAATIPQLVIIPDQTLYYLPFEALLTYLPNNNLNYNELPYLLFDYHISYHYSVTLLAESMLKPLRNEQQSNNFIGFAPIYAYDRPLSRGASEFNDTNTLSAVRTAQVNGNQYRELIYSEMELKNIEKLFVQHNSSSRLFLHANASTDNFVQHASKYKYVHIAAHGIVNKQQPKLSGILLSPSNKTEKEGMLYMDETYHLDLSADLLVLSCCETGLGQLIPGEGMMAINRGFLYAGAKNIIFTLFKVYDRESCLLTQYLFEEILNNQSYANALSAAKRKLLVQHGITPKSWAGFVLLGA